VKRLSNKFNESVKIGNIDPANAIKIGNLNFAVTQINGERFEITLNDVKYVPNL
jgi:hypothetical protein